MSTTQESENVLALIQRYARQFMRDPHDAEDLSQEVLIKVWKAYKRDPAIADCSDAQIAAWLLMITRRTAIDMVRTSHRQKRCQSCEELTDNHIAPGSIESGIEARELLNATLPRLPEPQRVTLLLSAVGYRSEEIEERENLTAAGVKGRLTRARAAIRAIREEWDAA